MLRNEKGQEYLIDFVCQMIICSEEQSDYVLSSCSQWLREDEVAMVMYTCLQSKVASDLGRLFLQSIIKPATDPQKCREVLKIWKSYQEKELNKDRFKSASLFVLSHYDAELQRRDPWFEATWEVMFCS